MITRPRFTMEDAEREHADWGANCGPGAIAAICRLTLDEVRPHMEACGFAGKGYTNPTMMLDVLERAGIWFRSRSVASNVPRLDFPLYGLARIQWHGPWMAPGVPIRARYRFTHWVGACHDGRGSIGVFDINTMSNGSGWTSLEDWWSIIVPSILDACVPRADGEWSITHSIEIDPPDGVFVREAAE